MKRNIKSLMKKNKVTYVKLSGRAVAEIFFAIARYEGFTLCDDVFRAGEVENCFVRLNEDMTISFPTYCSFAGAVRFHNAKKEDSKRVVKIDFEKLI